MNKRDAILNLVVSFLATIFIEITLSVFFSGWVIRIISFFYFLFIILWLIADIYYFQRGNSTLITFIIKDVFFLLAGLIFLFLCVGVFILYGEILGNVLFTCIVAFLLTYRFLDI